MTDKLHFRALCNYIEKEFDIELTGVQKGVMVDIVLYGKRSSGKSKEEIMQG